MAPVAADRDVAAIGEAEPFGRLADLLVEVGGGIADVEQLGTGLPSVTDRRAGDRDLT
jgi:hypothetical protein